MSYAFVIFQNNDFINNNLSHVDNVININQPNGIIITSNIIIISDKLLMLKLVYLILIYKNQFWYLIRIQFKS